MTACNPLQVQAFNTADVAEQIRATPGWVQHYQQMSPGHFAGRVRYLDLQGVEIYEEQMNTRVEQNFSAPEGALAFCFDRSDNSLYVLNGESRNIWITPENYQEIAVVFGPEFVQRHRLDVARLEGLFMSPLNSGQNALFSRWLSGTLTRLTQTLDRDVRAPRTRSACGSRLWAVGVCRALADVAAGVGIAAPLPARHARAGLHHRHWRRRDR